VFYDLSLVAMLDTLTYLNKLNHNVEGLKVSYDTFHISELEDYLDIRVDYFMWLTDSNSGKLFLCNYPFIFDAQAKTLLLQTDQELQVSRTNSPKTPLKSFCRCGKRCKTPPNSP
jgi:E3 ubiquitin-protein ligase HERC4